MKEKAEQFKKLKNIVHGRILVDEPLSMHTSYRIGGPSDYYIYPQDLAELNRIVDFCRQEGIDYFVIGNGTNILVSDSGFRGIVIDLSETFDTIKSSDYKVSAGSGVLLRDLIKYCTQRGLSGLESLVGIPGRVGGCVRLNAGAFGCEIFDSIRRVRLLDEFGTVERIGKDEIKFGYRYTDIPASSIILEVEFYLSEGNPKKMEDIQNLYLKERRDKQPLSLPSAGSVFKSPPGDYAGRLIDEAGCKGLRIGDALVSKKHANFIVNCRLASASDVLRVIEEVRKRVLVRFGVELELEIHLIGFNN